MTSTPAYCPVCGQPSPGGLIHASHSSANAAPTGGGPGIPTPAAKKNNNARLGCLGLVILLGVIGYMNRGTGTGTGSNNGGAPSENHLTGKFLEWVPVDEGNGYAYFSITNSGTTTETATCSISVKNDFGNFGFDSLVGESVGAGQTITGKIPLSVSKGSFLINSGEVTDC